MPTAPITAASAILFCSAVGFAAVAVRSSSHRPGAGARWFAATMGVLATGAAGTGLAYYVFGTVELWTGLYPLIVLVMPVVWARFAFEYYGLFEFTSTRRTVALMAPAVVAAAAGTWVGLVDAGFVASGPEPLVAAVYSGYVAMHFYSAAVLVVGVGLLVRTSVRRESLGLHLGAALALLVVSPWVGNMLHGALRVTETTLPGAADEVARAVSLVIGAVAAVTAVVRYRLFEGLPAAGTIGPETVLEEMDDLVIVLDGRGRVVRLNEIAQQTFLPDGAVAVGEPLAAVLGTSIDGLTDRDGVRLDTATGPRQFDPSVSELTNERDRCIGHTLVLRDVTERYTRRQRLSVLNRVLRHNLRNETATIVTRAEMIGEAADDDVAAMAEDVVGTALSIAETGDKARRIERMMGVPVTPDPRTDVTKVVRDVVESVGEETGCEIAHSVPEEVVARADHRVFRPVVEDVVENAVVHNDASDPTVAVTVSVDADRSLPVEVAVADDGPGIPEAERSPLFAGDEAPLEHGSGLGLWGVKWGVTRMGGSLEFESNEPRGTVVRIRVPTPADTKGEAAGTAASLDADPFGLSPPQTLGESSGGSDGPS